MLIKLKITYSIKKSKCSSKTAKRKKNMVTILNNGILLYSDGERIETKKVNTLLIDSLPTL